MLGELVSVLDFRRTPTSAEACWLRASAWLFGLFLLFRVLKGVAAPLVDARPLPILSAEPYLGYRYGLPESTRREIFEALAAAEIQERERAIERNTWNGHAWSREDDRGFVEMTLARQLAERHKVPLSAIYAVLDEGIREHWLGPDGKPLPATTPPQDPRSTW